MIATEDDKLAALQAQIARQEARLAAQEAALAALRRRHPPRRARRAGALVALALLAALLPLGALAVAPFTDLDPDPANPHNANIAAIYDAGITRGCIPPPAPSPKFCPYDTVTRQEMASFLARTAGLGGNPPVANALTAVSATSAGSATTAANAGNAAQLGGIDAASFPRRGEFQSLEVLPTQAGPFPKTGAPFKLNGGPIIVFASGSASTATPGFTGLQVAITQGATFVAFLPLVGYVDGANGGRTFLSTTRVVTGLAPGTYQVAVGPYSASTLTDGNDRASVTIVELPHP